jgi:hypothetical protein
MTELMVKSRNVAENNGGAAKRSSLSSVQKRYLERGLSEPGGKLPLFDQQGQRIKDQTIKACIKNGWCEPWYNNPVKPDWLVCKLTPKGRSILKGK